MQSVTSLPVFMIVEGYDPLLFLLHCIRFCPFTEYKSVIKYTDWKLIKFIPKIV